MPPRLFNAPVIVIDTETTGFGPDAMVIDIAAVLLGLSGEVASTFSTLVALPEGAKWGTEAEAVHHISRDMLSDAPPVAVVNEMLAEWLVDMAYVSEDDRRPAWATAFNIEFDHRMCRQTGIRGLRWLGKDHCVMRRAMGPMEAEKALIWLPRKQDWKFPGLAEAMTFFGLDFHGPAHRALTDAHAAADVLVALRRAGLEAVARGGAA